MRTTLDIDDDILAAVKKLARRERTTIGKFVSSIVRKALQARSQPVSADSPRRVLRVHGFNPIPAGGNVVTDELVNELREESGV